MPKCKYCNDEITWIKVGRKNKPLNDDGSLHSCEQMKKSIKSYRVLDRSSISPEEVAEYERRINEKK